MKEQLISFETAKLAKEKGFNELVLRGYTQKGTIFPTTKDELVVLGNYERYAYINNDVPYPAPTQSLLQKWLREKHEIHILVDINILSKWFFELFNLKEKRNSEIYIDDDTEWSSYEKALEKGLQEALKLI